MGAFYIFGAALMLIASAQVQAESEALGNADLTGDSGILFWSPEQQIYGYPRMAELYPSRAIAGNESPSTLPVNLTPLDNFSYSHAGQAHSIESHMRTQRTAGLLAIHKGQIKVERYGLEHHAQAPWVSFSVTKSVVSMLYGAAIKDGLIGSIDDPISDYLAIFAGSAYADVTIKNILQMSSGVAWNEDYADPSSDIVNLPVAQDAGFAYMSTLQKVAKAGSFFNYNTGETNIAGAILRKAIGENLSEYAAEKIFLPGGLSNTATWMLGSANGNEFAGCCISANLRDYGRLGLFALRNSASNKGVPSTLASGWMQQAITPSDGYAGYGFFWWLAAEGVYSAQGIFGQYIFIDTHRDLVIVLHSAWPEAWNETLESQAMAFIAALADHVVKES